MSFILIRYVLMAAMRDKLLLSMLVVSLLGVCLAVFSGSAAIIEQKQFVITYMAGGLRIIALTAIALFTVFFVRRSFDAREIEFLLTRPISRFKFVFSYMAAFWVLAVFAGAFLSAVVGGFSYKHGNVDGAILWCFGVTFEFMTISSVAFFFAMVLSSPVSAGLATFGFYLLSRLMGQVLAIVHHQPSGDMMATVMNGLGGVINTISVVIPRFDLMTQTTWLIYGGGDISDWLFIVMQSFAFLFLIIIATFIDLRKRQF